jgi:hypothetical protein
VIVEDWRIGSPYACQELEYLASIRHVGIAHRLEEERKTGNGALVDVSLVVDRSVQSVKCELAFPWVVADQLAQQFWDAFGGAIGMVHGSPIDLIKSLEHGVTPYSS